MTINIILTLSFFAFSSCKMTKESAVILPNVAIDQTDNFVIFSYSTNGKTGLYKLQLDNGLVTNWVLPVNGLIFSPNYSKDGTFLIYVMTEKENNKWSNVIYMSDNSGNNKKRILSLNTNIIDATLTPNGKRIYFTTASIIGNSSPIAKPIAKEMNIYSIDIKGEDLKKETHISAYNIGGKLNFDLTGKNLFFQMFNYEKDSVIKIMEEKNGAFKLHKNCGPYMFNIENKELRSLVPSNYENLHNKVNDNFLLDFLRPVPSNKTQEFFLLSGTTVYKLDLNTLKGDFFYEEPEEDRNRKYHIQSFIPLSQQNKFLMVKQIDKNENSFFILNQKGEVERIIKPNMESFKNDFK